MISLFYLAVHPPPAAVAALDSPYSTVPFTSALQHPLLFQVSFSPTVPMHLRARLLLSIITQVYNGINQRGGFVHNHSHQQSLQGHMTRLFCEPKVYLNPNLWQGKVEV